jgi:hypothetical protein
MMKNILYSVISVMVVVGVSFENADAYTNSHDLRQLSRKRMIWNIPTIAPPTLQELCMLKTSGSEPEQRRSNSNGCKLSQAAVNSMDTTFTSRRTSRFSSSLAHGLLSPEIVSRMDEVTEGGQNNKAVREFLQKYRRQGPMSCLEMLSDPEVLPHLTSAMRDLV